MRNRFLANRLPRRATQATFGKSRGATTAAKVQFLSSEQRGELQCAREEGPGALLASVHRGQLDARAVGLTLPADHQARE
jgi:hypothetical protein